MFCPLSYLTPQCIITHCSSLLFSALYSSAVLFCSYYEVHISAANHFIYTALYFSSSICSALVMLLRSTQRLSVILSTHSCCLTQSSSVLSWSDLITNMIILSTIYWYDLWRRASICFHFRLSYQKLLQRCRILSSISPYSDTILCWRHSTQESILCLSPRQ